MNDRYEARITRGPMIGAGYVTEWCVWDNDNQQAVSCHGDNSHKATRHARRLNIADRAYKKYRDKIAHEGEQYEG